MPQTGSPTVSDSPAVEMVPTTPEAMLSFIESDTAKSTTLLEISNAFKVINSAVDVLGDEKNGLDKGLNLLIWSMKYDSAAHLKVVAGTKSLKAELKDAKEKNAEKDASEYFLSSFPYFSSVSKWC